MVELKEVSTEVTDSPKYSKRDWLGSLVGLAIVVGGMAILYTVFREAMRLFAYRVGMNYVSCSPYRVPIARLAAAQAAIADKSEAARTA